MTQIVKFPDRVWAQLATIAERREITIAELLVETTQAILTGKTPTPAPTRTPSPRKHQMHKHAHVDTDNVAVAARIREMVAAGEPNHVIAAEFDVGYDAVRSALKRLGLKAAGSRPRVEVDLDRVAELHRLNRSDAEIAAEMGVAYAVVYRARRFQLHLPSVGTPGRKSKTTTNQETAA